MRSHLKTKSTRAEMVGLFWILLSGFVAMLLGIYIGVFSSGDHNALN
jgi:hypothetical protein